MADSPVVVTVVVHLQAPCGMSKSGQQLKQEKNPVLSASSAGSPSSRLLFHRVTYVDAGGVRPALWRNL